MSEPSEAEVAVWEDRRLDAQIDEYLHEKHEQRLRGEEAMREPPDDTEPDREPPDEEDLR